MDPQHSFRSLEHDFPAEICGWGSHPEYEIHLIQVSSGSFIAGDHVGTFAPGQVTLMGPDLPHDWVSDTNPGEVIRNRDAVIQFTDEWIHRCMELMPELLELEPLLRDSRRGLLFTGATAMLAAERIQRVQVTRGPAQLACLIDLLSIMANAPEGEHTILASEWLGVSDDASANAAMEAGMAYIFDNLTEGPKLATAARLAFMSEPTFSKHFKRAAGMTFSSMVKRLRIAHARRLLDSTDMSIAQIAVASGYKNIANFNRQFLAELQMTPSEYRRLDSQAKPPTPALSLGTKAPVATDMRPRARRRA
jgi:AraC-like DNA-binding protein